MEWEAVLVVLVTALAVSRTGDVVNAILGSVLPSGNIGPTSLKMDRLVLWIVAAVLAFIGHEVLEFDMLSTLLDVGDVDLIWNMLAFMSVVDAVDAFARKKLL
jgi:hypothetical protein|tara:strand:+ start:1567 stop:1875 length:309 start_codon:yes stop_codon:yes gene_type:complete